MMRNLFLNVGDNMKYGFKKHIMIIAGEASGDIHGANLIKAMKKKEPGLIISAIGGKEMERAGARIIMDAHKLSVVGITEVVHKIKDISQGIKITKDFLEKNMPDLLIPIDFPDFNLHIAGYAKKLGIKVLYYISPQIWAWRQGRVKTIGKRTDKMAVILPFEENFYKKHNVPATFTGHPLIDLYPDGIKPDMEKRLDKNPAIGILPGSRNSEIKKLLPVMLDSAKILADNHKDVKFLVSCSPSVEKKLFDSIIKPFENSLSIEIIEDGPKRIFSDAAVAIAVSGTITLEAAIHGLPIVVIYKVSPMSYWLGRALIRVDHICLVNLIAGRRLVPELIQDDASPANIAKTVSSMLKDKEGLKRLSDDLFYLRKRLGSAGASEKVARIAFNLL